MLSRLVLGAGALSTTTVTRLADQPGTVRVLDADHDRVVRLREASVPAERADVTDPAVVAARAPVDVVLVAGRRAETNLGAARAARRSLPDAYLIVHEGRDADADQREALETVADRVIGVGPALLDAIADRSGAGRRERIRGLRSALSGLEGPLGVFTHDNPDPDAIASAIALVRIAESVGAEAEAGYFGEISHQENRAMVNLLNLSLQRFGAGDPLPFDAYALVDHGQPGVNDQLPADVDVRVVLDHHPETDPPPGVAYVDRRTGVGATSTLLTEYVSAFPVEVEGTIGTALLYGIRVDTDEFRRQVSPADFEAAAEMLPFADREVLSRIEEPSIAPDTFETIASAIRARVIREDVLVACVGAIADRDALSQAADRLLDLEDISLTLVCGFTDDTVYLSARARGTDLDLGRVLQDAFEGLGSAGGHADMAGAQLPLGVFGSVDADDDALADMVEAVVLNRLFASLPSRNRT